MPQDATVYHHVPGFWQTHRIILVVSEVMGVPLVIIRFRLGFFHGNQPSSERPGSQGTPMTMETLMYSYNSFHLFSIDVPQKSSINHRYPTYFLVGGGVASRYEPRPPVLTDRCLILGRNVSIADDAVRLPAEEDVVSTGTISVSGRTTLWILWLFNIAMGNGPFIELYLLEMVIFHGYVAMLNNQMV